VTIVFCDSQCTRNYGSAGALAIPSLFHLAMCQFPKVELLVTALNMWQHVVLVGHWTNLVGGLAFPCPPLFFSFLRKAEKFK